MSRRRILIVEDEEDNLVLLTDILKLMLNQRELLIARDGEEAIRLAYEKKPDVILMDLSLPKLSGWEAAESLRSDDRFRDTPILALTANAMVGDREKALAAGCDDYLAKPIDVGEFVDFVRRYI